MTIRWTEGVKNGWRLDELEENESRELDEEDRSSR